MDAGQLLSELESIGAIGTKVVVFRPPPDPKLVPSATEEPQPEEPQKENGEVPETREALLNSLSAARNELVGLVGVVADLHERLTRLGRTLDVLQEAVLPHPNVKGPGHEAISEAS